MIIKTFADALKKVYINNPCKVQPNSLWKTLGQIDKFNSDFQVEKDDVKSLKLWNDDMLHTFWQKDLKTIDDKLLDKFSVALLHKEQINNEIKEKFSVVTPYFRILHDNKNIEDVNIPKGFYIREVDLSTETQLVSDLICSCYEDIKPSPAEVLKWTSHPVFQRDLWIWIIDEVTEKPAALGIAELDKDIKEGSLEWIQVLPDYQGKRLGKVLVNELLTRLKPHVDFTTVSGEVDNITNPERLYRGCGFYGDDIWYLLRK